MSTTSGQFDFNNPAFRADPYPAYRFLRQAAPIWRMPTGQWIVSTHAGCTGLLRDTKFGHGGPELDPQMGEEPSVRALRLMMLVRNPPEHTRLRGLVSKAFTARRMEALRPRIEAVVHALIDAVIDQGGMDIMADFARKLPVTVICDMLGVPEQDRGPFMSETAVRGRILDPVPITRADLDLSNAIQLSNEAYFRNLFGYRRANPGDDLTTALLDARENDDALSDDEVLANIGLLFVAGHETTTNLLGNGLLALHRNPEQLARLQADPGLIPNAVEELLRYDSPVQLTGRRALAPAEVLGQPIAEGEQVIALLGAANRDPAAYPGDPEALDVGRPGVRPISFGGGIHHCLGAQLARIEGEAALRVLLARLPALRLAEPDHVTWKPTITLRGPMSLPAVW